MRIIYIGDTAKERFTLRDESGLINLATTYTNITAWLMQGNAVLQKYSREAKDGHNTADFQQLDQTTDTGKFNINLQRAVTILATPNNYYWVIKVYATNDDYLNDIALESFEATMHGGQPLQFKELANKLLS